MTGSSGSIRYPVSLLSVEGEEQGLGERTLQKGLDLGEGVSGEGHKRLQGGREAQGLPTGSLLKVLDNTTGNQYLWSVSYYDYKAQVVQHRASTHLGGVGKEWFGYDFTGNVTDHMTEHKPSSGSSLIETTTQTYDIWGKPLVTGHKIGTGSGTPITVSNKTYDKVGRLSSDTRNGTSALASTYTYNIRSWVTGISGTLFTEELKYQDGTTARWGGDISQQFWKDNRNSTYDSYSFTYDVMGRLLNASYTDHTNNSSVKFTENVTYDTSGNIQSLERYGRTGSSSYGKIDNLAYTYSGNKLSSVKDTGSDGYSSDFRFLDGTNTTYSYTYDTAGRMTADASKGITSITWNILSQPQTVTFSDGSTISYKYAADGTKLQEVKTGPSNTATTDYTGTLVIENGNRSRLLFGNGYVSLTDNAYHYFITDHLGSVRVVASATGTAEEYNHYYPLGGLLPSSSSNIGDQPIKFQGKEWGAGNGVDLNLYDFGARRYDPSIGRWLSQDPLSEKYYNHTPYLYCAGNPLNNVDPLGKAPIYSTTGVFLGTDDRGLKGIYIVMEKYDFTQGMLHKDALKKQLMDIESNVRNSIEDHYATLSSRPDYDGYLTKEEADKWWLEGSGNPLYVDISKIDLPDITTESFPEDNSVIYKNFIWGLSNTGKTYGTLRIELLDKNTGEVLIGNQSFVDEYDFSMQKGRPLRNMATKIGRPGKEGKDFYIIGYGKTRIPVKKKKSVKK